MSKRKTKKISVFEIKKWFQTSLNMPIREEIPKNPTWKLLQISEICKVALNVA